MCNGGYRMWDMGSGLGCGMQGALGRMKDGGLGCRMQGAGYMMWDKGCRVGTPGAGWMIGEA